MLPNAAAKTTPHKPDNLPHMEKPSIRLPLPRCALILLFVFALALAWQIPHSDNMALAVNDYP